MSSTPSLRAWQARAIRDYFERAPRDYLAVATPGAGKTTFALTIAGELLKRRTVERVIVVTPTEHLTKQWAAAAAALGIAIDPNPVDGVVGKDFQGLSVTYAGVAANPLRLRRRTESYRTFVILDEVHHAGDALSWGDSVREAFDPATRRLALTGTPFRSDVNPIPFVTYAPNDAGIPQSAADHAYGYGEALRDGVVRPVLFMAYAGRMRWRTRCGDEVAADLGEIAAKDVTTRAWRTALNPNGRWIPQVLQAADKRLTQVRKHVPDAGGLVIAADQESARAYADLLHHIAGEKPVVVLSDDPKAGNRIKKFSEGKQRWIVAVRMVSEGVDIPRLSVGVYATNTSTPLFFAQAIGRLVRARRPGETATVFLPSVPLLLQYAGELEVQRDHVLGKRLDAGFWSEEDALLAAANAERSTLDADLSDLPAFEALESEATLDRVLFERREFSAAPGSVEEEDFLGIPGLLAPDQVATLLHAKRTEAAKRPARPAKAATVHEQMGALRRELQDCVRAYARQTNSTPAEVNAEVRRVCGGPPAPLASAEELQARIETLRLWATRTSSR